MPKDTQQRSHDRVDEREIAAKMLFALGFMVVAALALVSWMTR